MADGNQADIAVHIQALEEAIANRAQAFEGRAIGDYLSDDFREIGRSGTVYEKAEIVKLLVVDGDHPGAEITGFVVRAIGEGIVLA